MEFLGAGLRDSTFCLRSSPLYKRKPKPVVLMSTGFSISLEVVIKKLTSSLILHVPLSKSKRKLPISSCLPAIIESWCVTGEGSVLSSERTDKNRD